MKKHKHKLLAGLVIFVIVALVPFLLPLNAYIPQLEQLATSRLDVPVRVGALHAALLPTPRLKISDVTVGDGLEAESVTIVPAFFSLFSETRRVSYLHIVRPIMKTAGLETLLSLFKNGKDAEASIAVGIHEIRVDQASLILPQMDLPEINAEVFLQSGNTLESAKIEAVDGRLRVDVIPENGAQLIALAIHDWALPVGPPFMVDHLESIMLLSDRKLDIQSLDVELYDGQISASTILHWGERWELGGQFKVAGVEVSKPVGLLSQSTRLSGSLQGDGSFKTTARQPEQLLDQIFANFQFQVRNGVFYGVDLLKAANLLSTQNRPDGETRFDTLSGLLQVSGKQYHLRDINAVSGLIKANGDIKLKPDKKLDGIITVEIRNSAKLMAVPLQISGTPDKPDVFPTKAALAGAAVGTAILGPGVGTSIGIQAVDKMKNLFSND